ncbi:MAG: hypothetical protein Ct9H300mP28_10950 [Pseudomonadota bacterium]|nr:MAG: hypothetical protein Ct9H300mP28_10950 [Pseudomonadota bacterium]
MELVGIPDPETFCQFPFGDKRVARVFWFVSGIVKSARILERH